MTFDKDARTQNREELVAVLRSSGATVVGRYFRCPWHDDRTPSAEVRQSGSTGRWYFYCHACGIVDDVWALQARAEGRDVSEVLREARQTCQSDTFIPGPGSSKKAPGGPTPNPDPQDGSQAQQRAASPIYGTIDELIQSYRDRLPQMVVEEINPYTNPATNEPDLITVRYRSAPAAKKQFLQATPQGKGWTAQGIAGDRQTPLFNRIRLNTADRVLVVEGEKTVRAVTELGIENLVAVTSCGGAKSAQRCDWSPLAGKKVYVWADNDDNGRQHATNVIQQLQALNPPPTIYRVRVEELELPEHGDAVEYIAENKDDPAAAVELLLFDAEPLGASRSLAAHLAKIAAGEYVLLDFVGRPNLTRATQALLPGTVTIVAGDPESGKSFMVLEEAWRQFENGVNVRIMMLEDDHAFHLQRCLAQMSGEADLLDLTYVKNHITWAQELYQEYEPRLSAFGAVLEAGGSQERSLMDVADWIEKSAKAGARLIIADPITAASTGDQSWKDDRQFMMQAKFAAERYGASIILVTHPKLGKAGAPSLSGLAGGASYSRFSQTVLWMTKFPEMKTSSVVNNGQARECEYSRTVQVYKARNGKEGGKQTSRTLAVKLSPESLCVIELGMVI